MTISSNYHPPAGDDAVATAERPGTVGSRITGAFKGVFRSEDVQARHGSPTFPLPRNVSKARGLRDRMFATGGRNDGPPDLDELWRDFNKKLGGVFGGKGGANRPSTSGGSGGSNFQPDMKSAGIGVALIAGVVALIWLGSGFFIVQEGQQAVVTSFGKYNRTTDAGFQWRWPYPFEAHETVPVTQLRSVEVGRNAVGQATGLRDSSMLTQDE
ncbi:MAG: hflK, partial [Rhizobacter sp.]|nr:hflK [Rhizobacter sp.]